MNATFRNISAGIIVLLLSFSCSKQEKQEFSSIKEESLAEMKISDTISMAATQEIEGKKFVKNANINMEVRDVYEATIFIEKSLKNLGGFVSSSRFNSVVVSEQEFSISDEKSMLIRNYYSENEMQVRVPTQHLGEFLQSINDKNLFLHHRIITAEDVSANIKMAQWEQQRLAKKQQKLDNLKPTANNIEKADDNAYQANTHQISQINLQDDLKYSVVEIYLREPKTKVAEIEIPNAKNIKDKYKYNFWFDIKNAVIEGFYIFQRLIVALVIIWPFLLIGGVGFYLWRKRKFGFGKNKEKR